MGAYANDMLRLHIRQGIRSSNRSPRRRVQVSCCNCGKVCRGQGGLLDHQKQKHGLRVSSSEIFGAPVDYEEGT